MRLNYYYRRQFDLIVLLAHAAESGVFLTASPDSGERQITDQRVDQMDRQKETGNGRKKWREFKKEPQRDGAGHIRGWRGFDLMVPECPLLQRATSPNAFPLNPVPVPYLCIPFLRSPSRLYNHVRSPTSSAKNAWKHTTSKPRQKEMSQSEIQQRQKNFTQ